DAVIRRAGAHRPNLIYRRGTVPPRDPRKPFLARRLDKGSNRCGFGRISHLAVVEFHAIVCVVIAACRADYGRGTNGHRMAPPTGAVWNEWSRPTDSRRVLELVPQHDSADPWLAHHQPVSA